MKPGRFWIREDVYYTYACKQCEAETGEGYLRKIPKQPTFCPGSFASPEAAAHTMTQKFVMYSPLYRLEQEFERQGLKLSRQTMFNWILQALDTWLRPGCMTPCTGRRPRPSSRTSLALNPVL